jgi:hypothetical protein
LQISDGIDSVAVAPGQLQYAFPTLLQYGSTYSATINANPSNRYCSTSASGVITVQVNIFNISCVPAVSVAGTTAGTIPAGVVVSIVPEPGQIGPSESVTLSAGATTFTFNDNIPENVLYTVSVTSPAGYVCSGPAGDFVVGASSYSSLPISCVTGYLVNVNGVHLPGGSGGPNGGSYTQTNGVIGASLIFTVNNLLIANPLLTVMDTTNPLSCSLQSCPILNYNLGVFAPGSTYSITTSNKDCLIVANRSVGGNQGSTTLTGVINQTTGFDLYCN